MNRLSAPRQPRMLILSQVYIPDPAAVGQYMAVAASALVRRGWEVVVLTSGRGYSDPAVRFPFRQTIDGVDIRRLPLSSFGKRSLPVRALAAILFMLQVIVRGMMVRRIDAILVSTSPPMCIVAALIVAFFRRVPLKFWVMDINPDQLVALGLTRPGSMLARTLDMFNRAMLRRAGDVVVLDRFMGQAMNRKLPVDHKMTIIPPWPLEHIEPVAHVDNPFRAAHGLNDRFVFMYSGNHGIALPLETFLAAAVRFRGDPRISFVFIGDGKRKKEVEAAIRDHRLPNMISLPYQPLDQLKYSLSAADAHLVTMSDSMGGTIHPCKIYGAMAVARPIIYLGPSPSYVTEMFDKEPFGVRVAHGDVDGMAKVIREWSEMPSDKIAAMGAAARRLLVEQLDQSALVEQFCAVMERGVRNGKKIAPACYAA